MNYVLLWVAILLTLRFIDSTMVQALLAIGLMIVYYATSSGSAAAAFLKILFLLSAVGGAMFIPALGTGWGIGIAVGLFAGACTVLHLYTKYSNQHRNHTF